MFNWSLKLNMLFFLQVDYILLVKYYLTPQWSFGWPSTLFVWMGRRRAGVVALLVSMLEASFGATSFHLCLESRFRALIRMSVFCCLFFMFDEIITQYVEIWDLYLGCIMIHMTWLFWRFYYLLMRCYDEGCVTCHDSRFCLLPRRINEVIVPR